MLFALLLVCRLNAMQYLMGDTALPHAQTAPRACEVVLAAAGSSVALPEGGWVIATGARRPTLIQTYRNGEDSATVHIVFAEVGLPGGDSGVVCCTSLDFGASWDAPLLVLRGASSPVACVHEARDNQIIILAHYDQGVCSIAWPASAVDALIASRTVPGVLPTLMPAPASHARLGCGATYSPFSHKVFVPAVMNGGQVALLAYCAEGQWEIEQMDAQGTQPAVGCWRPADSRKAELLLSWRSEGMHYRNTATRADDDTRTWAAAPCALMGAWQSAACNASLVSIKSHTKLLLAGPTKRFWKGTALSLWDAEDRSFRELAIITRGNTASPHVVLDDECIMGAVMEDSGGDIREEALVGLHFVPRRVVFVAAPAGMP